LPPEIAVKSHTPRPKLQEGNAIVALSGGAGSTALLEMLYDRAYFAKRDPGADRRKNHVPSVWNRGYVVHVDFSNVANVSSQMERLRAMVEERGLTIVPVMAEDAFDSSFRSRLRGESQEDGANSVSVNLAEPGLPLLSSPSSSTATPLEQLQALLAALPPPSRPALLGNILEELLACVAETLHNVAHLLVGETSTREAQRVISGTASGRGWSLPLELARSRTLPNKVLRIKAMKELSLKEAAFWCHGRRIETFNQRRWDSTVGGTRRDARGKGTIASIEALTERGFYCV
jgi:cytoplasmic tRNA 2-thiolation protein 2